MMKNYDPWVQINHNQNWTYIPDHPHRILIIDCSGSRKTNMLLNLIKYQRPDIDINLLICQRSIWIKVSIVYKRKRKNSK